MAVRNIVWLDSIVAFEAPFSLEVSPIVLLLRHNFLRVWIHLGIDHSAAKPALQSFAKRTNETDFRNFQIVKDVYDNHGSIFLPTNLELPVAHGKQCT